MRGEPADEQWEEEEEQQGGLPIPEFLLDPMGVAGRRRLPMVICFVLGLLVTAALYLTWTPIYGASATILITRQKIPENFVQPTVREDTIDNVNAMLGQVLSIENLSELIEELDLFPELRERVPRADLVNIMRSRIGTKAQENRSGGRTDAALVYEIGYVSPNPREATTVANALAALFVEASIERRNVQARQTTGFLREELERDEAELREHSKQVAEFRREHRGVLPDELNASLAKLDRLADRRKSLEEQIAEKESRIVAISTRRGDAPLTENEILLGELRRELARESAVHTEEHPNVIALQERIAKLQQEQTRGDAVLPVAQQALIENERRDIFRMRSLITDVDVEMSELSRRIDRTPTVREELTALEQKETVLREDYLQSLRKVEAAELAESLESARQGGQVQLLDAAQHPTRPTWPRWMVAIAGFLASLAVAAGVAVLLELIDPVVVGSRQLEKLADRPVLGSLPDVA